MGIVTGTDAVTGRRAVSQSAWEEGREGPGQEGPALDHRCPVRSGTNAAPIWVLECEWS